MSFMEVIAAKAKGIVTAIQGFTRTQAIIAGVVTVTAVGGVGTGGYFLYNHFNQPEPTAIVADIVIETEQVQEPTEEVVAEVEEVVTEETEAAEPETVNLVGSSIEKDLKIKVQDKSSKNVKGQPFEISVKADKKNAKETTYKDDDKDGIIYIKSIEAGKYKVSLNEIEGYVTKEHEYSVTVKDKIEYKEVAVKDEIKSEAEVAPAEDAEVDNVEVEAVLTDTVPTLDSTCTPTKVSAADVDTSNFPKAEVAGSSKADITQEAGTKVAKNVSYRASGNGDITVQDEEVPDTSTKEPTTGDGKSTDTGTPSEGGDSNNGNNNGENGGGTETPDPKPETSYDITVTHVFYKNDGQTKADKANETETINVKSSDTTATTKTFDGYTAVGGNTLTLDHSTKNYTVKWVQKAAEKVTYTVTHEFYQKDGKTKAAEPVSQNVEADATATQFNADSYESKGYKLAEGSTTTITVVKGQSNYTVKWISNAATAATASVSIPQTATLYNSTINNANTLSLAASIADESKIVTGITWASSDEKIVKVTNGARTGCTITAAGKGSATVTATITYLSKAGDTKTTANDKKVTCTVTVKDYSGNSTTQLKDKSGRGLYKDSECKTPATLADYKEGATYYTEPQYTGWQTIDGKVYYYNANHQRVTGSQVISGITYNFGSDGALQQGSGKNGIDVSSHQGNIDWASVKAAGISFAIIRVGYRGSQTGALVEDSCFKKNIQGATANGISVGVYFFTQAVTEAEAVEEASMALSLCSGYSLAYPIFVDTENGSGAARANGLDKASRTACVSAFCKTVANGGRKPGVYASKSWYNSKIDASAFSSYFIWVAQYNTTCTYKGKYNMWQYSSKGSVPGIKGNVDVNIAY